MSTLARDPNSKFVFVDQMHEGEYGRRLKQEAESRSLARQVQFTGLADMEMYSDYLEGADLAVQLGCAREGKPLRRFSIASLMVSIIVIAHGSLRDLPADTVPSVADEFTDEELSSALELPRNDPKLRRQLSLNGQL